MRDIEKIPLISTARMKIFPLNEEEMQKMIDAESDIEMKKAYSEMLDGCRKQPEQWVWYAIWVMQLTDGSNRIAGDLCFKGLSQKGCVEIGYGVQPEYEGRGLMTEAVIAMVRWALQQAGVCCVEAETEADNYASQRVLQKAGFIPNGVMGEEGPRFVWKGIDGAE